MTQTPRKRIPKDFIRNHMREGFGVEDIGVKLRAMGVTVTDSSIRLLVEHWHATGQITAILRGGKVAA